MKHPLEEQTRALGRSNDRGRGTGTIVRGGSCQIKASRF
jgi:hypothetical protein